MTKKIRWGIIGTGAIAHSFASDFRFVKEGLLHAVASRKEETAQKFADEFNISKAYGSYDMLFRDPEIDAVYIATPHNFHFQNAYDAINEGKAVLCEKPITINTGECRELMAFAKEKQVYLMEGMWTYFLPAIQRALQWVEEGRIGDLKHLKAEFGYPVSYDPDSRMYNPKLAGGSLLDMGIYPVAMACLFQPNGPIEIQVKRQNAPTGVDQDMIALFDYGHGQLAHLHSSFQCKLQNHLFVIGTKGTLQLPNFWRAKEVKLYEGDQLMDQFVDHHDGEGYHYETNAVNADLLNGLEESLTMPLATSLRFQEIMEKMLSQ